MNDTTTDVGTVYFTFTLGDVTYAIDVNSVKEVLGFEPITRVPRTEKYMKGVMNIRGSVISVIDFRIFFNISPSVEEKDSSIVVTEVTVVGEPLLSFGFIADTVNGVSTLDSVVPKTEKNANLSGVQSQFIKSLGRLDNSFVLILDLEKILFHIEKELTSDAFSKVGNF